jgi:molybdate transport system substrate-binding protein
MTRWIVYAVLAALCAAGCTKSEKDPLLVAAAADLRPAFLELGEAFEAATGQRVVFTFGSSGLLAQQLIEGAPMDLFTSASAAFVDSVLAAGVGDADTRATYAVGRLAIWSRHDRWGDWGTLAELAADDVATIAIANPVHAPYGVVAVQALESAGVREAIEDRLVYGENIADTQRLAATGNADAALVALSLALASEEAGQGRFSLIDDALHDPIEQVLVVTAKNQARAAIAADFVAFLTGDEGHRVLRRLGFATPRD